MAPFVEPPEGLPIRLMVAVAAPVILFLTARALVPAVLARVDALDLGLVVAAQSWRVIGVVFLILRAIGDLPAVFAMPAGLGDIAVGALAASVTFAVVRQTSGWQGRVRVLVVVGMIDFVVALGSAILVGPGWPLFLERGPTPETMQVLPMAMIPTFGVPLFMILHLITLIRLRRDG